MAIGSAIPEITVNVISSLGAIGKAETTTPHAAKHTVSEADLGVGGILGSGLIAFLIIPSLCVAFSPDPRGLVLKRASTGVLEG